MQKYTAIIESQRVLEDCENVPYLLLFLNVDCVVYTYITYSTEHLHHTKQYAVSKLSQGNEINLVGECLTISPTHHVFIGRISD